MKLWGELHSGERWWHTLGVWPWNPLGVYKRGTFLSFTKQDRVRTFSTPCTKLAFKTLSLIESFVCTSLTTAVSLISEQRCSILQKYLNGNGMAMERVYNGCPLQTRWKLTWHLLLTRFFSSSWSLLAVIIAATGSLICLTQGWICLIITGLQWVTRCKPLGTRCDSNGCRFWWLMR